MNAPVAGVLLTGGTSSRLGTDKANMPIGNETLATRAARVLATVCEPVIEVGSGATRLRCVREDPVGAGPLAALLAGVDALGATSIVLLACDLPRVDVPILRALASWPGEGSIVPVANGRAQFACARYGPQAIADARAARAAGRGALAAALDRGYERLEEQQWLAFGAPNSFFDVDTPEDARALGLT